ncbi:MAG: hypothetical protein U9R02_10115, partial [Thermodesulfobacteriota bacterium]|nr:hypothetical protein [Thermodesulfobacteriota bacterium]
DLLCWKYKNHKYQITNIKQIPTRGAPAATCRYHGESACAARDQNSKKFKQYLVLESFGH